MRRTDINDDEIIEFYQSHSASITCEHFKCSNTFLNNVLKKHQIPKHSRQENTRLTCIEKYGVENVFQNTSAIQAAFITKDGSLEAHYKKVAEKMKETNLKKYGTTCSLHSKEIDEKTKQTNLEKYGCERYFGSDVAKQYIQENKEWIQEKAKQGVFEKYGAYCTFQAESVKEKIKSTMQDRYGVDYFVLSPECRLNGINDSKPNLSFANKLLQNSIVFEREFPLENRAFDFKVDNTLIEINPSATHNSTWGVYGNDALDRNYHKDKSNLANRHGFRCIHVWDWDDIDKVIRLLLPQDKIYARCCNVREVPQSTAHDFINMYHLQGYVKDSIRIGLFFNDDLVSIMTFGKPRYNKKYQYELIRYCSSKNIVGGAEKLFKYFLNNYTPQSIISYCDLSKFDGNVYNKLGFVLKSKAEPSKHWYNMKTCKHITDNLLRQRGFDQLFGTNYGKGTSNVELMLNNNFVEVYDCGQATYIYVN